ncbi:MAG: winged helix-turn-helix domain-containing protein [Candidatus Bathyarchaeia archaeon]|nr:winged helix-turn-helix transcriptional regulator [Candidatus Bathyarchaeota archaeon]
MSLKLLLVKDGETIFEIPLTSTFWSYEKLKREIQDLDFNHFLKLFQALSNVYRLKMMMKLLEYNELMLSFSDFMREFNLNPKVVSENIKKLQECELLEKSKNGKYRCSKIGEIELLLISIVLNRVLKLIKKL